MQVKSLCLIVKSHFLNQGTNHRVAACHFLGCELPDAKAQVVPSAGLVGVAKYVYAWICLHSITSFLFRRLGSDNMWCIHVISKLGRAQSLYLRDFLHFARSLVPHSASLGLTQ